jgi:hypothetical protein
MAEGTALARRFRLDINIGTETVPNWQELKGLNEFNGAPISPITQADMHYDSDGWKGYVKTAQEWLVEGNVSVKRDRTTKLLNTVHQFLEDAAKAFDGGEIVQWRFYDRGGQQMGGQGWGIVTWTPDGGDAEQKGTVAFSLMPDADRPQLEAIANPLNATPIPIVSAVSPSTGTTAGGDLVTISGAHFTGTTTVEFGATPATEFTIVNDSTIVALTPAVAASTVKTEVTTPNGSNTDTAADNFTFA